MELQERLHRYGKLCIRPMMLQFSTFRRLGYGGYLRKWEGIFSFSFFYKRLWMCGRNIEYMEWLWERGPKVKLHWKTFCTRLWSFVLFCFFLEKAMATHYITLAWKIPWTEEPGGLQYTGSQRVRHTELTSKQARLTLQAWSWLVSNAHATRRPQEREQTLEGGVGGKREQISPDRSRLQIEKGRRTSPPCSQCRGPRFYPWSRK